MYICYLYSDSEFHNEIGLENYFIKETLPCEWNSSSLWYHDETFMIKLIIIPYNLLNTVIKAEIS